LRDILDTHDDSPIRPKRVRNAFEHFDEFIEKMPNTIFIGRNIGPPHMIHVGGEPEGTRFGQFDPNTGEVTFWDRTANLREIIQEAQRIRSLARD
jgi:hypothetical protein